MATFIWNGAGNGHLMIEGRIGVLGGTFDPIHGGHLDAAAAARRACALDTVLLVPARAPAHRASAPRAPAVHRFAMAALAAQGCDDLRVSDIELRYEGPSFTSVTLERLAALGHRPEQLFFITGADAFADIAAWHDYPAVLDRSHFVVVARPGHSLAALRAQAQLRARMREAAERRQPENAAANERARTQAAAAPQSDEDPVLAQIRVLMRQNNPERFTRSGKPRCRLLSLLVGRRVSAKERDAAWAKFKEQESD